MLNTYAITDDDLIQMGKRMAAKESCYIPVRSDIQLTDGRVATNCLSWGHPNAYELAYNANGLIVTVFKR